MGKEGYSREGFFGEIIHYDSKGNKIGESRPGFWGDTYSNYDAKGNKIGETRPGLFGEYNTYDTHGNKTGSSSPGLFGTNHFDADGQKNGTSNPGFLGINTFGSDSTAADLIGKGIGSAAIEQEQARVAEAGTSAAGGTGFIGKAYPQKLSHENNEPAAFDNAPDTAENEADRSEREYQYLSKTKDEKPKKLIRYILVRIPNRAGYIYYLCDNAFVKVGDMVSTPDFDERAEVQGVVVCEEDALPCLIQNRVIG